MVANDDKGESPGELMHGRDHFQAGCHAQQVAMCLGDNLQIKVAFLASFHIQQGAGLPGLGICRHR